MDRFSRSIFFLKVKKMFDQKYKEELESKLSNSQKAKFNFLIAKNIWSDDVFDDLVLLDNSVIYRYTISNLISSINNIISYGISDKLLEKSLSKEIDDCIEKTTSNFKLNNLFIFSNEQISSAQDNENYLIILNLLKISLEYITYIRENKLLDICFRESQK